MAKMKISNNLFKKYLIYDLYITYIVKIRFKIAFFHRIWSTYTKFSEYFD